MDDALMGDDLGFLLGNPDAFDKRALKRAFLREALDGPSPFLMRVTWLQSLQEGRLYLQSSFCWESGGVALVGAADYAAVDCCGA